MNPIFFSFSHGSAWEARIRDGVAMLQWWWLTRAAIRCAAAAGAGVGLPILVMVSGEEKAEATDLLAGGWRGSMILVSLGGEHWALG